MPILLWLSQFSRRRPWWTGVLLLLWVGVMGYFSAGVPVDNSYNAYFIPGDKSFESYKGFQDEFGSDEFVYVMYRSRTGEPLLSEGVTNLADSLAQALGRIPWAGRVISLTGTGLAKGGDDELRILSVKEMRKDSSLADSVESWLSAKEYLKGNLFTSDMEWGAIFVEMTSTFMDTTAEKENYSRTVHDSVNAIVSRSEFSPLELVAVGDPLINHVYNQMNQDESSTTLGLSILVVLFVVLVATRSWRKALLVLLVVTTSLVSGMGLIGILGWKMNLLFVILPSLLLTISLAESIRLVHSGDLAASHGLDPARAAAKAASDTGRASFFAWITTVLGFLSMAFTSIQAVREFAVYTSFGLTVNFLASYLLTPLFVDRRTRSPKALKTPRFITNMLESAIERPRTILAVASLVAVAFAFGIPRLKVESNWIEEFSDRVPVKHAYQKVNDVFGGTGSFSLVLQAPPESLLSPATLASVERFQREAERIPSVSKTLSLGDLLKDVNASFHSDSPEFRRIPDSADLIAQYLLAYEFSGGEDLDDYLSKDHSSSQVAIRIRMGNTNELLDVFNALQDRALELFPGMNPTMTGISSLSVKMAKYIQQGQIRGFGFALLTIAVCLVFAMRSVRLGVLCMIPNILPITIVLGFMGWTGIKLDYVKVLISSLALGLAVDDTIHFWGAFRAATASGFDAKGACREVVRTHGRPIWMSSLALMLGFLINVVSSMQSLVMFGVLTAMVIALAFLSDLLVGPALLALFGNRAQPKPAIRANSGRNPALVEARR
ncbi:MAG: MMPL family transporter [Fibrobacteria bacterium]|nr:MMPL family transporter [Fibrobacteria bacterium]